jgi:altronate dehydratase large subunit
MDTPFFSPESITAMVASGAQLVLFTTGAGNSYCSLVAPTLKVSANPAACTHLTEQIDIAADHALRGDVAASGGRGRARAAARRRVGTLTFGEIVGEGDEVVSRLGPSI